MFQTQKYMIEALYFRFIHAAKILSQKTTKNNNDIKRMNSQISKISVHARTSMFSKE